MNFTYPEHFPGARWPRWAAMLVGVAVFAAPRDAREQRTTVVQD